MRINFRAHGQWKAAAPALIHFVEQCIGHPFQPGGMWKQQQGNNNKSAKFPVAHKHQGSSRSLRLSCLRICRTTSPCSHAFRPRSYAWKQTPHTKSKGEHQCQKTVKDKYRGGLEEVIRQTRNSVGSHLLQVGLCLLSNTL